MPPTRVFFRDDDVTERTPALELVSSLLVDESIPCNYALVPERLTPDSVALMRTLRDRHPGLVRLNQHGHRHFRLASGGRRVPDEFGGCRPFSEQLADLAAGRDRMRALLGDDFDAAVFTPPCHKYDTQTLRALDELGFSVVSASVHTRPLLRAVTALGHALRRTTLAGRRISYHGGPIPGGKLSEISVAIDVDEEPDGRGGKRIKSVDALRTEFERARARLPIVGVMLHHPNYHGAEKADPLRGFIRWLKRQPDVELHTIEDLAATLFETETAGADAAHARAVRPART